MKLYVKSVLGRNAFRQVNQVIEAFRRHEGRTFAADYAAAHKQHPAKGVHEQVRPAADMLGTFCLNSAELAVISCRKQHGLVARREGLSKTIVYGTDLFHTMLHVSKHC